MKYNASIKHNISLFILAAAWWTLPIWAEDESEILPTVVINKECPGGTVTLTAQSGDGSDQYAYIWSTGETTRSITVPVPETPSTTKDYYVNVYSTRLVVKYNMIVNGDFESGNSGFTSDYNDAGFDPIEYYDSHPMANNLYSIISNTKKFSHYLYADIYPHGGNYMAYFDAGEAGYAWIASTWNNPKLKIKKDSVYQFSYWAAHTGDNGTVRARLQFEISYRGSDGWWHYEQLGTIHSLGLGTDLNGWEYNMINWTAPENSDDVSISVVDLESAGEGNDFVLDDIIFQNKYSYLERDPWRKEPFQIKVGACTAYDTICLGEKYTGYGYNTTPTSAAMTTPLKLTGGDKTVYLTVLDTIKMVFTPQTKYCVDDVSSIVVPMTMTSQYNTMRYSITYNDSRFTKINNKVYAGESGVTIPIPAGLTYPTTVKATVQAWSNEYKRNCPTSTSFSFNLDVCSTHDTICLGEKYTGYGYNTTPTSAAMTTPLKLTGGDKIVYLTVLDTIKMVFTPQTKYCVDDVSSIFVPMTMTSQYNTMHYSITYNDSRFTIINDKVYAGESGVTIPIPAGLTYPTTVKATVQAWSNEYKRNCPTSTSFTFNLDVCSTHDTICLGEKYTGYGYNTTPTSAAMTTPLKLTGGDKIVYLTVLDTIKMDFTPQTKYCVDDVSSIFVPMTMTSQYNTMRYSITYNDSRFTKINNKVYAGESGVTIPIPAGLTYPTTVKATVQAWSNEYKRNCPTSTSFTFNLDVCSTHDTICLGEKYTGYGYNTTPTSAAMTTPLKLTGGMTDVYLTVLDTIVVTYDVKADICTTNRTATATVHVQKGNPHWYSLEFSSKQMSPISHQQLLNHEIVVQIPQTVSDESITVYVELEPENGDCGASSSFSIDLRKNFYIYAKWDDVLFVNNGQTGYKGTAVAYQWYHNGVSIPGADKQCYYAPGNMTGEFFVEVKTSDGKTDTTCPFSFDQVTHSVTQNNATRPKSYQERKIVFTPNFYILRREYEDGEVEIQKILQVQ